MVVPFLSIAGSHSEVVQSAQRWSVPALPQEVRRVRHEVAAFARSCGMTEAEAEQVALAVSEAVANSVLHAYLDVPTGDVTVSAWADAGLLTVVGPSVTRRSAGLRPRRPCSGGGL